jgi:hypothetical protein
MGPFADVVVSLSPDQTPSPGTAGYSPDFAGERVLFAQSCEAYSWLEVLSVSSVPKKACFDMSAE